ncbi:hypothetical protein [Argonema antarcticum]|uniref:hypothetical protein n=1 Tax=Argonema antarcticum TaxID=2942763 RepID=UPI00201138EA|nr:hypothetical protein [Argonema antarcticum]MCL1472973.1 hypothetical protein [Argonema antarcticum A004/B2]
MRYRKRRFLEQYLRQSGKRTRFVGSVDGKCVGFRFTQPNLQRNGEDIAQETKFYRVYFINLQPLYMNFRIAEKKGINRTRIGFFRYPVIILSAVAIGCLVVSCGESKVTQCNKINQIINQADAVTKSAKTGKPSALIKAAVQLDKVAKILKDVEVEDKKLQSLRSSFTIMYGDISKSFRNMAVSIQRQDAQGIKFALIFLSQARMKDTALVKEINSYCDGK